MMMKKISFQKPMLCWVAAGLFCALSTPLRAEEPGQVAPLFNARDYLSAWMKKKVGEPHEVRRTLLFNNLPFLKLKSGDKLVKGKYWFGSGKSAKAHFDREETFFLFSKGKFYKLEAVGKRGGKIILESSSQSLLFDWKVDLKSARRLGDESFDELITLASFADLKNALWKDFPETLRDVGAIDVQKPHLEGAGKTLHAVFQGLGFDEYRNTICKYQLEVGNGIYIVFRKNLIVGPRRVRREEFEGEKEFHGPNAPGSFYHPDAATAAKARAAYDRMIAFQNIVNKFLVTPRSDRSELNY